MIWQPITGSRLTYTEYRLPISPHNRCERGVRPSRGGAHDEDDNAGDPELSQANLQLFLAERENEFAANDPQPVLAQGGVNHTHW
jgi:hypothetical protein